MDISYDGQFTEEVLLSVLPFLPLRCDDYDQETVLSWLNTILNAKKPPYMRCLVGILRVFADWLNLEDLEDDVMVGERRGNET